MTKHQVADLCEVWQSQVESYDVFDPMFEQDAGEAIFVTRENNWVANEMWNYFDSLGVLKNPQSLRRNLYDVMEVYCSEESELTSQAKAQGLMAERFCRRDGDLSTITGRKALYDRLLKCLPRNLWLPRNALPGVNGPALTCPKVQKLPTRSMKPEPQI